jgi:hypothetical protein
MGCVLDALEAAWRSAAACSLHLAQACIMLRALFAALLTDEALLALLWACMIACQLKASHSCG